MARGHAAITLRLDVGGTALLCSSVAEGRLTFAVCSAPPGELGLIFEPLFREPIGLLLRHALAQAGGQHHSRPAPGDSARPAQRAGLRVAAQILEAFTAIGVSLDIRARVRVFANTSRPPSRPFEPGWLGIGACPLPASTPTPTGTATRHVDHRPGLNVGGEDRAPPCGRIPQHAHQPCPDDGGPQLAKLQEARPPQEGGADAAGE